MSSEPPKTPEESWLLIRPSSGLVRLLDGGSPAMAEIISRSLAHIHASKALSVPERRPGEEMELEIASGVKLVMCWIPPGEFLMGSPEDEEGHCDNETQHRVEITKGFWLAKTPTTQAQWQAVMGSTPSFFKGKNLSVDQVSWNDICGNESGTEGFLGELNKLLPSGGRFQLPTEAQWEYARRAGTTGPHAGELNEMGWYSDNSDDKKHPVGKKKQNAWGLQGMLGNTWEWCSDWYGDYDLNAVTDPTGPASGSSRVFRGGDWDYSAGDCRVASRDHDCPTYGYCYTGFRVARSTVP